MHQLPPGAIAAMNATTVVAKPEIILEFNHTLMGDAEVNAPDGLNESLFPKESVIAQRFATTGIPKAIVGQALAHDQSNDIQYRVVSEDDSYQYWVSPSLGGADAWMEVTYDTDRITNKIVVGFEVSNAAPTDVDVFALKAGSWVKVFDSYSVLSDGLVEIYPQSNGSWTKSENIDHPQYVGGVRVVVNQISSQAHVHVTHISARYRVNVAEKITNFGLDKTLDNPSPMSPIGNTASDTLSFSLENEDRLFDPENTTSPFYGLMSRNVRADAHVFISDDQNDYHVHHGIFYVESWDNSAPSVEVGADCSDSSRFMQETYLSGFLLIGYTVKDAVREVLNRGGFKLDVFTTKKNPVIPYVWYDEEVTLWQALQDIATASLAHFYIDDHGKMSWIDFESLAERNIDTVLDADSNLIRLNHGYDVMSNIINIDYNVYGSPVDEVSGEVVTQELWGPPGDESLLSQPLKTDMTSSSDTIDIAIDPQGFMFWPESGIVSIQGERIRYSGKDNSARALIGLERGVLGSTPRSHSLGNLGRLDSVGVGTGRLRVVDGSLHIGAPSRAISRDYYMSLFGDNDTQQTIYGTRLMFPNSTAYETAGLVINRQGSVGGIYIELSTTTQAARNNRDELRVYRVGPNDPSNITYYTPVSGVPYEVAIQNWYDVEIAVSYTGTEPVYTVYVNGMLVVSFTESRTPKGEFGCYVRGFTRAMFSHLYTSSENSPSITGFQDVLSGSSFSSSYVYDADRSTLQVNEFVPRVRQVKEFNVDFSLKPVTRADIINTNYWQSRVFGFEPSPFGAKFYVENISDRLAVIEGTSPNLFEEDTDMYIMAYGDPIVVASEGTKIVKDKSSIQRNGRVELTASTPWIQSEEMVDSIANLIMDTFSEPMDVVDADVFPNYSIQTGDVVSVDYGEHGYYPETHQYTITSFNLTWNNGFTQSLSLRRRR